jgi:hypothetical protein
MPIHLVNKPSKLIKPDSQTSINLLSTIPTKSGSSSTITNIPQSTTPTPKRTASKTSVFSKIFK